MTEVIPLCSRLPMEAESASLLDLLRRLRVPEMLSGAAGQSGS